MKTTDTLAVAAREFGDRINERITVAHKDKGWVEVLKGPNYFKVVHHDEPRGSRAQFPATFCFIVRKDQPFDWLNYRSGDILPPMTSRRPWKMDTGAVGSIVAPDGGMSYWVDRYGIQIGLW